MSSAVRNGGAQRLKDGVWAIRVLIPDNPLGYTLVYALAAASGVVLVDGGWDCDEAWRGLRAGLRECGFDAADVRAVLVTHGHPDHIGLTRRIKAASGCQIVMHRGEVPDPAASGGPALEDRVHFLSSCGVPEPEAREFAEALTADPTVPTAWSPDRVVEDFEPLRFPGLDLVAVYTPGHTPGHLCYLDRSRRLLFTGDHLLTSITPNISTFQLGGTDPLGDYLASIEKLRPLSVDHVLPGHQAPFGDLGARLDATLAHHRSRLTEVASMLDSDRGTSAWEVCGAVRWSKPLPRFNAFMRYSALGETLSHLVHLQSLGLARYDGSSTSWRLAAARS